MPVRFLTVVGLVLFWMGTVAPASADNWFTGIFKGFARNVKDRQEWPNQYNPTDKAAAVAPTPTMIENGWRRQNMLIDAHFDPETKGLTEAGKKKVRWILTAAPPQHRNIYVHLAESDEETTARVAAVQQYAGKVTPKDLPPILTTNISEDGWPADQIDSIGKKYLESMPAPSLPSGQPGVSSGGGK